jgi:hypothetical protein
VCIYTFIPSRLHVVMLAYTQICIIILLLLLVVVVVAVVVVVDLLTASVI